MTIDELIRAELGDYYEQRRILTLRLLAAYSDPELRHPNLAMRNRAARNQANLTRLIWGEWRGRRGPRYNRIVVWVQSEIRPLSVDEMQTVREEVFRLLDEALPPLVPA